MGDTYKWMWEVCIKSESSRDALWWGKKSHEQSAWYQLWKVTHLPPWTFPGHQVPALTTHMSESPLPVNPSPTDLYTGSSKESPPILNSPPTYTSATVSTPSIPILHSRQSPDVTCTWPRDPPPPLLLHANCVTLRENMLVFLGNRTRTSAVGFRHHNHHATN